MWRRRWQSPVLLAVLCLDLLVLWAVVDSGLVRAELHEVKAALASVQSPWTLQPGSSIGSASPKSLMTRGPFRRPSLGASWSRGLSVRPEEVHRRVPISYVRLPRQRMSAKAPAAVERPSEFVTGPERCFRYRGRPFCDGPRRVPASYRDERAERRAHGLGLGAWEVGAKLLRSRARRSWREAVDGNPAASLLWPVPTQRIGRGFGQVRSESDRLHPGLDLPAQIGDRVVAVAAGMVAYANNGIRGYGNTVMIVHPGRAVSVYAHLSEIWVLPGERVEEGQTLALAGDTGLARGPHLHFEWRVDGDPVDPSELLRAPER